MSRVITVGASARVLSSPQAAVVSRILTVSAVGTRRLPTAQVSVAMGRTIVANPITTQIRCDILMQRTVTATPKQVGSAICKIFIGRIPPASVRIGMFIGAVPTLGWTAICRINIGLLPGGTRIPIVTRMQLIANPSFSWKGQVPIQRAISIGASGRLQVRSTGATITRILTVLATGRVASAVGAGISTALTIGAIARLVRQNSSSLGGGLFIVANPSVSTSAGSVAVLVPRITVLAKASVTKSAQVTIARGITVSPTARHPVAATCNILTRCQLGPRPPFASGIQMWLVGLGNVRISSSTNIAMGRGMTAAGRQRMTILAAIATRASLTAAVTTTGLFANVVLGRVVTASPTVRTKTTEPIATRMAIVAAARRLITGSTAVAARMSFVALGLNASVTASASILTRCQMTANGRIKFLIADLIQCRFVVGASEQILRRTSVLISRGIAVGASGRVLMSGQAGVSPSGRLAVGTGSGLGVPGNVNIAMGRAVGAIPNVMIRPFLASIGLRATVNANLTVRRSGQVSILMAGQVHVMGSKSNPAVTQVELGMTLAATGEVQFLSGAKSSIRGAGPQGTIRGAGPQGGAISGK